jgi:hypothetical protein
MKVTKTHRLLSVYPNHWGVGFAVFDDLDCLIDYGMAYVQPADNEKSLERIQKLISLHQPNLLVTRHFSENQTTISPRVRELVDLILQLGERKSLAVRQISRAQIQEHFSRERNLSKYDISRKLITQFPKLESCEFPIRKRWMGEHHYVGIFDAVAIVMVCVNR